jgi:hypothetical protein
LKSAPGTLPVPRIWLYCFCERPPIQREGSYVGLDAMARMRPDRGSITMAAPPVACRYFPDSVS